MSMGEHGLHQPFLSRAPARSTTIRSIWLISTSPHFFSAGHLRANSNPRVKAFSSRDGRHLSLHQPLSGSLAKQAPYSDNRQIHYTFFTTLSSLHSVGRKAQPNPRGHDNKGRSGVGLAVCFLTDPKEHRTTKSGACLFSGERRGSYQRRRGGVNEKRTHRREAHYV